MRTTSAHRVPKAQHSIRLHCIMYYIASKQFCMLAIHNWLLFPLRVHTYVTYKTMTHTASSQSVAVYKQYNGIVDLRNLAVHIVHLPKELLKIALLTNTHFYLYLVCEGMNIAKKVLFLHCCKQVYCGFLPSFCLCILSRIAGEVRMHYGWHLTYCMQCKHHIIKATY